MDELAVTQIVFAHSGIQASNPQGAECAFLGTTVSVCVLTCVGDGFFRKAKIRLAAAEVALGSLENFFATGARRNSSLRTWHSYNSLCFDKQTLDSVFIGFFDGSGFAQIAFALCRHLSKNVAKTSAFELHVAAAGHAEALLGTAVGFHLRHY